VKMMGDPITQAPGPADNDQDRPKDDQDRNRSQELKDEDLVDRITFPNIREKVSVETSSTNPYNYIHNFTKEYMLVADEPEIVYQQPIILRARLKFSEINPRFISSFDWSVEDHIELSSENISDGKINDYHRLRLREKAFSHGCLIKDRLFELLMDPVEQQLIDFYRKIEKLELRWD